MIDKKTYNEEVKKRWENTEQYKEYSIKAKDYSKEKFLFLKEEMNNIFKGFSVCLKNDLLVSNNEVQLLVKELQDFITLNYYICSNDLLLQLGKMYITDERFKNSINQYYEGLANYVNRAIEFYCEEKGIV